MKSLASTLIAVCLGAVAWTAADATHAAIIDSAAKALAPDAVFAQVGRASDTSTLTLGLQWNWSRAWRAGERGRLSGYNEISVGRWQADEGRGSALVTQVGFTPTFRYWPDGRPAGWFFEGAVGVNVLTPIYRTREKHFSTAFNFGDHVAVGYKERGERAWEWSLRLQHFSNAGIEQPNPGENFVQVRLVVPLARHAD